MIRINMRRKKGLESKKSLYGFLFVLPWMIGIIALFIIPLGKSMWYTVSEVGFGDAGGIEAIFTGYENFQYIFTQDPNYVTNLRDSCITFMYQFPIIVIISLLFATILNQKFRGRLLVRSIFFLPVIIATGVVMQQMSSSVAGQPLMQGLGSEGGYDMSLIDIDTVFKGLDFPEQVVDLLSRYISIIFNLIWNTGIQVILFMSGMQTIPDQMYEVSKIEGATRWEEFWFVTIPMLKNIILIVMLYNMVDSFITINSPVVQQAYNLINALSYGLSSAMLWGYIIIAIGISALLVGAYHRFCMKRWE